MELKLLARNLTAAFEGVPDPRRGRRQYPLRSILALSALAALDGAFKAREINRWGKTIPDVVVSDLGFPSEQIPDIDTLIRIAQQVDRTAVREALEVWRCSRGDGPDSGPFGPLRVIAGDQPSKSLLFNLDRSVLTEGYPKLLVLDQVRVAAANVPGLRRWKRTHAVL